MNKKFIIIFLSVIIIFGCQNKNIKNRLKGENVKEEKKQEKKSEKVVVDEESLEIEDKPNKSVNVKKGVIIAKSDSAKKEDEKVDIIINKEEAMEEAKESPEASNNTKKPPKNSKSLNRVQGYRIQLLAATDKKRAKKFGKEFKEKWKEAREDEENAKSYFYRSDVSIYIEYYKPYWKLRIGNYKTRKKAEKYLKFVKRIGYEDAWIISTTVLAEE